MGRCVCGGGVLVSVRGECVCVCVWKRGEGGVLVFVHPILRDLSRISCEPRGQGSIL